MNNFIDELEYLKDSAKPFYFEGTKNIGILLVHGFTASPTEMLPLGKFLNDKGFPVHGVQLAGHGTDYRDLGSCTWHDWYNSVENGYKRLKDNFDKIIPIGLSMGALLCLNLVKNYPKTQFPKLVLLAPPFSLKSRLVMLAPLLNLFVKFSYKGEDSLHYFKKKNLYSYMYRPTASIIQLTRLIKHIKQQTNLINIPTLIFYGAKDDMVSIPAIEEAKNSLFSKAKEITINELPNSGHIVTVEPDSLSMFNMIDIFLK
ncbi:MAG: alpha/beta hydrolase [Candidatus Hodarchaeales archaeon]|jgi:carboxylesterase